MRTAMWLTLMMAALSLGAFCGCESGGGDDNDDATPPADTNAPPATNTTPKAKTFVDTSITLNAGSEYNSGSMSAPGDGTITAHIKVTTAGKTLKAWFVKASDLSVHSETTGSDFTIAVTTLENENWRLMIRNEDATDPISADVTAQYNP